MGNIINNKDILESIKQYTNNLKYNEKYDNNYKVQRNNYRNYWYTSLNDNQIQCIRTNYKVIDVECLNFSLINLKIFNDKYFQKSPEKKKIINNMLEYYLNDKDKDIYIKTDYICNERNKICICNTRAEEFRKTYDGINYKENKKYISWCKNENDKF